MTPTVAPCDGCEYQTGHGTTNGESRCEIIGRCVRLSRSIGPDAREDCAFRKWFVGAQTATKGAVDLLAEARLVRELRSRAQARHSGGEATV